jgi:hypothetical protein
MTTTEPQLHVFFNDHEWYVAATEAEAHAQWLADAGEEPGEWDADMWQQLDDNSELSIVDSDDVPTRKTCREWAIENGAGYLCAEV